MVGPKPNQQQTIHMSREIRSSPLEGESTRKRAQAVRRPRLDYKAVVVEDVGPPPPKANQTSEQREFIQKLRVNQSFLVPHGSVPSVMSAFRSIHGKGSSTVRKVDLEYSRVYRIR